MAEQRIKPGISPIPPELRISGVSDSDYSALQGYIDTVRTVSMMTYQSVYVIDFYRGNFLYVSEDPLFLCGRTPDEVMRMGFSYYSHVCLENEIGMMAAINKASFSFFYSLPAEKRTYYSVIYNIHLRSRGDADPLLVEQRLMPLKLTERGDIWLALCLVSLAADSRPAVARMVCGNSPKAWAYDTSSGHWAEDITESLTENEKTVISLSKRGMTVSEIGRMMYKSAETVKGYRKSIFAKLRVSSITEAIACAESRRLI